jgi:hypothetical protein
MMIRFPADRSDRETFTQSHSVWENAGNSTTCLMRLSIARTSFDVAILDCEAELKRDRTA